MLKEELRGCTDRLDVGEARESKMVPGLLAQVRCGSLRRPLTPADKVQPIFCSLCMSFMAVSPVATQTSCSVITYPVGIMVPRGTVCVSVPHALETPVSISQPGE